MSDVADQSESGLKRVKRYGKNVGAFLGGFILALLVVEIVLQFYNPFGFRVRGDEIVLPANRKYTLEGVDKTGVDTRVVHTKNSIGFRGPQPPEDFEETLTFIAVGGSTTECLYLSDGDPWPARLGKRLGANFRPLWVNNAGYAGQSTYGHILLINDYLSEIKPDYALYLIGINDVDRDAPGNFYEKITREEADFTSLDGIKRTAEEYSMLVSLVSNIFRSLKADRRGFKPITLDPRQHGTRTVSDERLNELLEEHREQYLDSYRERVENIVKDSRKYGIEPILITQPAFYGTGVDPTTGVNRGPLKFRDLNSRAMWEILELYNDVTRSVARKNDVKLVDLAERLPKDWKYFHDFIHFTKPGARNISAILHDELCPYLSDREPGYQIKDCS